MTNEKELKLWEQSKVRYERIGEVVEELLTGVGDIGNRKLKIPPCGFCKEMNKHDAFGYCDECPYGKKFKHCGIDENSEWMKLYDLLKSVIYQNKKNTQGNKLRNIPIA